MKLVALLGIDPHTMDFGDPSYIHSAEVGADQIRAKLDRDTDKLREMGYDAELVLSTDGIEAARSFFSEALSSKRWDCLMIGAAIRKVDKNFLLFEMLVNLTRELAPRTPICFNTTPEDMAETVKRCIEP